jgi:hypothetical protein
MITVEKLIEILQGYPKGFEVIFNDNRGVVHIINCNDDKVLLSPTKPIGYCTKCGSYCYEETNQGLEDYIGFCPSCDENLFEFEIDPLGEKEE